MSRTAAIEGATSHRLGIEAYRCRDYVQAAMLFARAASRDAGNPEYLLQWGSALQAQGRDDEAMTRYRQALALRPDIAAAHFSLGLLLQDRGQDEAAEACYRRALELEPGNARAHHNLGVVLLKEEDLQAAEEALARAIAIKPAYAEAHNNRGLVLQRQGRLDEAVASFRRAVTFKSDYLAAHLNLGDALREMNRTEEAIACFRQLACLSPEDHGVHFALAGALMAAGRPEEAVAGYRRAVRLKPETAEAHYNLGIALMATGRRPEAAESCRRAIALQPEFPEAHYNLGKALAETGRLEEAEASYTRALDLDPYYAEARSRRLHLRQHLCHWEGLEAEAEALLERVAAGQGGGISPCSLFAVPGMGAAQQRECARQFAEQNFGPLLARPALARNSPGAVGRRLRIAYLSADFHGHATSYRLAEVIDRHDRKRFETFAYSCGPGDGFDMEPRVRGVFDRFRDIGAYSPEAAARRIAEDGVDILVDLQGYAGFHRARILALRPAPVQVNWLGYPGTLGHRRLADYLIGDPVVTPLDQAACYSEALALLPHCCQPNEQQFGIGPGAGRSEAGLPDEGFVFCCFNQHVNIAPAVFELWCRLLRAVPGSVLWLLDGHPTARENLRREAVARGIEAARLVFSGRLPRGGHLARLGHADLVLDTFPYASPTTAGAALWAGVPFLTYLGNSMAGRLGASFLHAGGMSALVARSGEDYFRRALELATHPECLAAARAALAVGCQDAPLFDSARFTRDLERLYTRMWENHCAGRVDNIVLSDGETV